jgi:thiamine biosynthesis protein ThiS
VWHRVSGIALIVNGDALELQGSGDIPSLITQLGADGNRIAVMLNDAVIARDAWTDVELNAGDRVEVLTFAGGG